MLCILGVGVRADGHEAPFQIHVRPSDPKRLLFSCSGKDKKAQIKVEQIGVLRHVRCAVPQEALNFLGREQWALGRWLLFSCCTRGNDEINPRSLASFRTW